MTNPGKITSYFLSNYEAHCINVIVYSSLTNTSNICTSMQYTCMCLFLHSLIAYSMLVPLHYHYYIVLFFINRCHFCVAHLSVMLTIVCSTRAQPVETCWAVTDALSYTFCVQKHLSALCEKMLVFLQSLPWVVEGKYGGWNIFCPSCYLLLSPSQYPFHTYSSSPILYIYSLFIYFSIFMSNCHQVFICIIRW